MSKNHNIDELFRRGANKHQFQPKESDWNAVASQLGSKRSDRIWRWLLPLFISFLIGSGALIYLQANQSIKRPAEKYSQSTSIWQHSEGLFTEKMNTSQASMKEVDNDFENTSPANVNTEKNAPSGNFNRSNSRRESQANIDDQPESRKDHARGDVNDKFVSVEKEKSSSGVFSDPTGNKDVKNENVGHNLKSTSSTNTNVSVNSNDRLDESLLSDSRASAEQSYNGYFELLPSKNLTLTPRLKNDLPATDTMLQRIFEKKKKPGFNLSVMVQLLASPNFIGQGAAIEIGIPVNPNISFSSGVGYWRRPVSNLEYMSTGNSYGFGKDSVAIKLEPQHIHYLNIPLKFTYRPNVRHQVTAGLEGNILINTYSKVTRYERPGNLEAKQETWESWGYKKPFKAVHLNFLLGYEYRLNEFWSFGINTRFGYTRNLEKGLFNKDQLSNRNASILLRYHVW